MPASVFLGKSCLGGVSTAMAAKLAAVETDLRALWQLLGMPEGSFEAWAGVREPHRGMHPGGEHTNGNAIDVNYFSNPYIATRTPVGSGVVYGGERTTLAGIRMARVRATVVYDRAVAFQNSSVDLADVRARLSGETTLDVHTRFQAASDALRWYLSQATQSTLPSTGQPPPTLHRAPVPNAQSASLATLLAAIGTTERLDEAVARSNIMAVLNDPNFEVTHPDWSIDTDFWLRQILRDYEIVRIPMVVGNPSLSPQETRNPANGFLDLRQEVVLALADSLPLMRWGMCDFGADSSGDVQHFDLAPRLASSATGAEARIDVQTTAGVQQALASLDFDPGPVNGAAGGATQTAITLFRQTHGLPPGGIDDALRSALEAALQALAIPF